MRRPVAELVPFEVRAFACQKAGNAAEEYEDAWAFGPGASSSEWRVAVADGATESSFSGLWAVLLAQAFVRGRAQGAQFFERLEAVRKLWAQKTRRRALPWYAREKAARGAHAAFVGVSASAESLRWTAVAVGDCCVLHLRGAAGRLELTRAFPLSRSDEFGSSPFLVGSTPAGDDPVAHVRMAEGDLRPDDVLLLTSDAMSAWLLRRAEMDEPAWESVVSGLNREEEFEALVAKAREEGARNDDMTLIRLSLHPEWGWKERLNDAGLAGPDRLP